MISFFVQIVLGMQWTSDNGEDVDGSKDRSGKRLQFCS